MRRLSFLTERLQKAMAQAIRCHLHMLRWLTLPVVLWPGTDVESSYHVHLPLVRWEGAALVLYRRLRHLSTSRQQTLHTSLLRIMPSI